jgi:hypothetical protein
MDATHIAITATTAVLASAVTYYVLQRKPKTKIVWPYNKNVLGVSHRTRHVTIRLKPGQDPVTVLEQFTIDNNITAATIVSCVGSLTKVHLRYANNPNSVVHKGHMEIVSLVGCLSKHGMHVHICVSGIIVHICY